MQGLNAKARAKKVHKLPWQKSSSTRGTWNPCREFDTLKERPATHKHDANLVRRFSWFSNIFSPQITDHLSPITTCYSPLTKISPKPKNRRTPFCLTEQWVTCLLNGTQWHWDSPNSNATRTRKDTKTYSEAKRDWSTPESSHISLWEGPPKPKSQLDFC